MSRVRSNKSRVDVGDLWITHPVLAKSMQLTVDDTAASIAAMVKAGALFGGTMVKAGALFGGTITNAEIVGEDIHIDVSLQSVQPVEHIDISVGVSNAICN